MEVVKPRCDEEVPLEPRDMTFFQAGAQPEMGR